MTRCARFLLRVLVLLSALASPTLFAQVPEAQIQQLFPKATRIEPKQEDPPVHSVYQLDELLGYAFESTDYSNLQGFSGKPIRLLIGLDTRGVLTGVTVLEHHEPVFLHGLGEQTLYDFVDQYRQVSVGKPIVVGSRTAAGSAGDSVTLLDGVSKATVSVVILNETVLLSALSVARKLLEGFASGPLATPRADLHESLDWAQLLARGLLQHWTITRSELESALGGTLDDYPEIDPEYDSQPFSELYFAYLNAPMIGRNLLGDEGFARLNEELKANEQALLVLSSGMYRHVPDDFVPATVPARLVLMQNDHAIELHDMNFNNGAVKDQLNIPVGMSMEGFEANIFRIKTHNAFNPAEPAGLRLNVRLQRNHLVESSTQLTRGFQLDPYLFETADPLVVVDPAPIWLRMWHERWWQISLLGASLILLTGVFIWQHRISRNSRGFHLFRAGFLMFTLVFIGLYAQGQLSVVNIFTLLLALWNDFDIRVFLMDPVIFILWSFTFISLLIWGRGVFCGWLCPFGALQEMLGWAAKGLRIPQWKISDRSHHRLQWVKYLILIGLVPTAFFSLTLAERLAEVEPFKTSMTLFFLRSWPFVLYALILLGLGLFVHKFYCRYVCPLGAGLAILGKFRLFSWLERIDACGQPCQHCKHQCEIGAIKRDGRIDYDECIQCLECIVILNNEGQCVASISARKKAARAARSAEGELIVTDATQPRTSEAL
ncbi:NosR/NirI family protein [Stutzerimonas zhaodongensis]|uniref:NosR/NirI family protein n=1 Tax=Stutzerimonas zhaodongensis TaxID=1176257 RepID=UPI00210320FC|nr:NosR/NirI family protein [Stutzerimonas zhaodongensis]MCQ2030014.1 NosR/NirI family protein [Stutzerimonas zhaodongensis]